MRIGITCPLYIKNWKQRDFVNKTTESIKTSHEWLWIPVYNYVAEQLLPSVWHFTQPPAEIHIVTGRQPQAITKAWNDGIAKAITLGCEYVLVIGDDIVLKSTAIDNLVAFVEDHKEGIMWSMHEHNDLFTLEQAEDDRDDYDEAPHPSNFMVHKTWPQEFGLFDENFVPAYFEDSDAYLQLVLANKKLYRFGGARFFHFGGRTVLTDNELLSSMPLVLEKAMRYFRDKWGCGVLGFDQMKVYHYKHPYNIEELAINEYIPDYWDFLAKHGIDSVSDTTLHKLDKQIVLDYLKEKGMR